MPRQMIKYTGSRLTTATIEFGRVPEWPMGTDCKSTAFQLRWFESTRAHEKTASVEIHWRFSFAQTSDSHRRVDSYSSGADCNDDERRQRRKQRGVVGAAASDTQARRSGCWVPQPVCLRRKQGGEAGAALRFFKAPPRGCRKIGKRNS